MPQSLRRRWDPRRSPYLARAFRHTAGANTGPGLAAGRTHRMTPQNGNQKLGAAAKEVAEHASALTRLELELATLELKKKATSLGVGIGLGVAAALLALLGVGFALATAAAAIALVVPVWLALLIVTGALFLLAGV